MIQELTVIYKPVSTTSATLLPRTVESLMVSNEVSPHFITAVCRERLTTVFRETVESQRFMLTGNVAIQHSLFSKRHFVTTTGLRTNERSDMNVPDMIRQCAFTFESGIRAAIGPTAVTGPGLEDGIVMNLL